MIKISSIMLAAMIALACHNTAVEASIRRSIQVQEEQVPTNTRAVVDTSAPHIVTAVQHVSLVQPVQEQRYLNTNANHHVTPVITHDNRFLANVPCIVDSPNRCTPYETCACPAGYTVKENLRPDLDSGCYQCSKADGVACSNDAQCQWSISDCIEGTCQPKQCSNSATVTNNQGFTSTSSQCTYDCECSLGEYTVAEELNPTRYPGCFHCAKPDGATCEEDHECRQGKACVDGTCGVAQCDNTAVVDSNSGTITSYCTMEECECSGEYSVKERLGNNNSCFHCAKPDGATCTEDHECMRGKVCGDSGVCGMPQCKNNAIVSGGWTTSYCTPEQHQECQCTGSYSVKEEIMDGCYHCAKPNGESCVDDHECKSGSKCLNDNKCGVPVNNCPRWSEGRCTWDSTCVCSEAANPTLHTHTFRNGTQCYACKP